MNFAQLQTDVRDLLGDPAAASTTWTDAQVQAAINVAILNYCEKKGVTYVEKSLLADGQGMVTLPTDVLAVHRVITAEASFTLAVAGTFPPSSVIYLYCSASGGHGYGQGTLTLTRSHGHSGPIELVFPPLASAGPNDFVEFVGLAGPALLRNGLRATLLNTSPLIEIPLRFTLDNQDPPEVETHVDGVSGSLQTESNPFSTQVVWGS